MPLVVVSGAIANKLHHGGEAWVRLSYVLGLQRLGFRVHFLEQIASGTCVDVQGTSTTFDKSENRTYFEQVVKEFGLVGQATLCPVGGEESIVSPALIDLAESADVLLNISGHLRSPDLLRKFRRKVLIDVDPGFTQVWHEGGSAATRLDDHDDYFTIAENVNEAGCRIPRGSVRWRTTRPPVLLDQWPAIPRPTRFRFTTVASWRGAYGPAQLEGRTFGVKAHEFRKVLTLPSHVAAPLEIALDIHADDHRDREALEQGGWTIADPREASSTPGRFRRYVQQSAAEFSVAQGIYVDMWSGWFSDRTTRYLASGRPALVQDTGFSRSLPTGEGLVAFTNLAEAAEGARRILADYEHHAHAARSVAERCFNSDTVLGRLMEEIGVPP